VAARPETVVFFQIPDIDRILDDRGFWDIYYEHCSYYSAGSLARLFRHAGYHVINVWRDYGDQYLMIEARPAISADAPLPIEETVAALEERVMAFSRSVDGDRAAWQMLVREAFERGRKPVIWGGGSKAVTFLQAIGVRDEIAYVVDINPNKSGTFLPGNGQEVVPPAFLTGYRPDLVILMNPIYREEVGTTLRGLGLSPELVAIDEIALGARNPGGRHPR
jgi:hypothetical protein